MEPRLKMFTGFKADSLDTVDSVATSSAIGMMLLRRFADYCDKTDVNK